MALTRSSYWAFGPGMKVVLDATSTIEEVKARLEHIGKPDATIFEQTITRDKGSIISNVFTQVT